MAMAMLFKVFQSFFRAMTGAYALNLLLYLLAFFLIGESWVLVALFNSFVHLLLLPSLILLPLCLLMRQWQLVAMLLPSVLFFSFTWGTYFLPKPTVASQADAPSLRILSFNIGAYGQDPELVLDLLREVDADIVTLQELGSQYAAAIENNLGAIYPYMALHPQQFATQGQGVLSRFPLGEDTYWQYEFLPAKLGHQRVTLPDLGLTIYNLHPSHPGMTGQFFNPSYRSMEIADILARAEAETGALLLVGDFNMTDLSNDYAAIRQNFNDAFRETGFGMGWTFTIINSPAFLRLDYLFFNAEISAVAAEVLSNRAGSDHHPLLVTIQITGD